MTIPTWALVLLGAALYVLIGVTQAVVKAFRDGRSEHGHLYSDNMEGYFLAFAWPVVDLLWLLFWVLEKYGELLEVARKRGKESVLKEQSERRIDGL